VCERKNHSKPVAAKQGMLEEFCFKLVTRKFIGEEFAKDYAQK
jgi:hypothetical protein